FGLAQPNTLISLSVLRSFLVHDRFAAVAAPPQRAWINPVRMQCEHFLVEVQRRRCSCRHCAKVMYVSPSFLDMPTRAIGVKHTMTCYHRSGMHGFNFIQRSEPLCSGPFIGLSQI